MKDGIRLSIPFGLFLHMIGCLVFVTGATAAAINIMEAAGQDIDDVMWIKTWALMIHGGAAMVFMVLFGYVIAVHVRNAWAAKRNRWSGSLMIGSFCLLMITGYGLYYFSGDVSREVVRWMHVTLGLLEPILLIAHILLGRRTRLAH